MESKLLKWVGGTIWIGAIILGMAGVALAGAGTGALAVARLSCGMAACLALAGFGGVVFCFGAACEEMKWFAWGLAFAMAVALFLITAGSVPVAVSVAAPLAWFGGSLIGIGLSC